ncbi:MAG: hypothetical protein J2P24_21335 [Streptosporangiales bacterium]|nr:hypothetical protein [Streptosporangiales bacterium]
MSLLDTGNEPADVYPETVTTDADGNTIRVPATDPVRIMCRIQPLTSTEAAVTGQDTATTYRLIARDAPLGAWSRVVARGRDWDVQGEPLWSRGSPRTRHVTAILRARDTAPLAAPEGAAG